MDHRTILGAAEAAEQEVRGIEDRSTNYWLLEYLARYEKDARLPAVVLDPKGGVELQDYYLRTRLAGLTKTPPGTVIDVQIEAIEPERGDVRFRIA